MGDDSATAGSLLMRVRTQIGERLDWRETVTLAHLYAVEGARTSVELGAELDRSRATMRDAASTLSKRGLVVKHERPTDTRGPARVAYDIAPDVRAALADDLEWTSDALEGRVVRELAARHYVRGLSSARSKQIARAVPEATVHQVRAALGRLQDRAVVERLSASTGRWRLVDVSEFAPFRAPGTSSEEVAADD